MTPVFRPFDPAGPVRVYCRHLPHWRQAGATYFVAFRQDDSIPAAVLAEWHDVRQRWYRAHNIDPAWLSADPERFVAAFQKVAPDVRRAFEREQARLLHEELDRCHGSCVLRHAAPRQEVVESLSFFHGTRLWLGDYVVMPNHVHAIVIPMDDWALEDLIGSVKRWTARRIGVALAAEQATAKPQGPPHNRERFWQQESYDRIIRDAEELSRFRQYIAKNPQAANTPPDQCHYAPAEWLDAFAPR